MQTKFRKSVPVILAGIFLTGIASAHPGHAPTDLAANISEPLAGVDHFAVFAALVSILLVGLRFCLSFRKRENSRP